MRISAARSQSPSAKPKPDTVSPQPLWLAGAALALCLLGFLPLHRLVGPLACALAWPAVAAAGWLWGLRGGLVAGALSLPLNLLLCHLAGVLGRGAVLTPTTGPEHALVAHLVALAVGGLTGRVRELRDELAESRTRVARAREALAESERRHRLLTQTQTDLLVELDPDGAILFASPSFCEAFGKGEQDLLGSRFTPLIHAEDREAMARAREDLNSPPHACRCALRVMTRLGWRWLAWQGRAILDESDQAVGIVWQGRDITELKRTREALHRAEARYESLVENLDLGVSLIDSDYRIVMSNGTPHSPHNSSLGDVLGRRCFRRYRGLSAICPGCPGVRALATGQVANAEMQVRRGDGTVHTLRVRAIPLFGPDGAATGFIEVVQDLSERRSLEEQLRQAQKMEAVGHLVGGIAHDFSNLLTVINGYSDAILGGLEEHDALREELDPIRQAGERAVGLTRRLLAFSRQQGTEAHVLNLNNVLDGISEMLSRVIDERVKLETRLAPDLGSVRIAPGHIEQVVVNLAVNARDAMPDGGVLTVETANVELSEGDAPGYLETRPGAYVLLAVSDTGCGMTPEVKEHLFEPFFTTKEPGKGTGLGLATVYGIVKENGGTIQVDSEPGLGTTFRIHLPRVDEVPEPLELEARDAASPRGRETILVVEDQPYVREFSAYVLRRLGYTVLEAPHGPKALDLVRSQRRPIDLVLADMVMPHMSGQELVEELGKLHQGFGVLYMSGYSDNGADRVDFIAKPFTTDALAQKVRELLDRRRSYSAVHQPAVWPGPPAG